MFDQWDIDRFPLEKKSAQTPGQRAADEWLHRNPDPEEMRAVTPQDIERLIREHRDDPADRNFGVNTSGGGLGLGEGMHYPAEGYNQPLRQYPGRYPDAGSHESHDYGDELGEWDEDDEENGLEDHYHIVTRPRDSIHGLNAFDEHPYFAFGNAYRGTPDSAMEMFAEDNPEYDTERYPNEAIHDIVGVHRADDHDDWHGNLADERDSFRRIEPHGLQRENPEIVGHRTYRHEDPYGGIHRLWHSPYSVNGSGWHTSYYNPELAQDQQMKWTEHPDSHLTDSLGEALGRVDRSKAHADISHSGTGLNQVENSYGHHYVSKRPDGSIQQLLRNNGYANEPNWGVTHYDPSTIHMHSTEHGGDLPGALAQAKANLTRG